MSERHCSSAVCVVCERGGFWGVRLRQKLRGDGVVVRRCGSVTQCWPDLELFPSSIVLLEAAEADLDDIFEFVCRIQRRFPRARSLVVLPRSCEQQQWWLREAGAVHVVRSSRELETVARLVRRHVQQAPANPKTWTEQVYAGLPWSSERSRMDF